MKRPCISRGGSFDFCPFFLRLLQNHFSYVVVLVVWVTIYGMCNIFKIKRGELLDYVWIYLPSWVFLKCVANTLSHVSVISFVHEKGYCRMIWNIVCISETKIALNFVKYTTVFREVVRKSLLNCMISNQNNFPGCFDVIDNFFKRLLKYTPRNSNYQSVIVITLIICIPSVNNWNCIHIWDKG